MRTLEDMVRQEVRYCASELVHTLAQPEGPGYACTGGDLGALQDQAMELAAPVSDHESAARDIGWERGDGGRLHCNDLTADTWEEACDLSRVDPHDREVFEHWIISDWLADKLEAKGEKVDKDFAGLTIWARTITGQAIYLDPVMEEIHKDLMDA